MKRAWILLAVMALVALFAPAGEPLFCTTVKNQAVMEVGDESGYRNHGQYVRAAAHWLRDNAPNISEACHDCIMSGFAQGDPEGASCNFPAEGSPTPSANVRGTTVP